MNSPAAAQALEFYKGMYECCAPPGHSDAYMVASLDAYKSGQVAMQMNWFAFFPGIAKDPEVGGAKSAPVSGQGPWISTFAHPRSVRREWTWKPRSQETFQLLRR